MTTEHVAAEPRVLGSTDILNASDITVEDVDVPEWNGIVRVQGLNAAQRDAYESSLMRTDGKGKQTVNTRNMRARLLVQCIVDADGNRVFGPQDADRLGEKSGVVISRLFEVASRLSGIGGEALETIKGNSESARPDGSSSA